MNEYAKAIAIILILVCVLVVVFYIDYRLEESQNEDMIAAYNNGVCRYCGGDYRYLQAVGHLGRTVYLYVCDKCNNTIETIKYFG